MTGSKKTNPKGKNGHWSVAGGNVVYEKAQRRALRNLAKEEDGREAGTRSQALTR